MMKELKEMSKKQVTKFICKGEKFSVYFCLPVADIFRVK